MLPRIDMHVPQGHMYLHMHLMWLPLGSQTVGSAVTYVDYDRIKRMLAPDCAMCWGMDKYGRDIRKAVTSIQGTAYCSIHVHTAWDRMVEDMLRQRASERPGEPREIPVEDEHL